MQITDRITRYLEEQMQRENGYVQFQRNALASLLGCAPSQITYVVASHYTAERGYRVESRRGGGGYIRITRVRVDRPTLLMHFINSIGPEIDTQSALAIVRNLYETEAISQETARLLQIVLSDTALRSVPRSTRDVLRADLMRQVLIHCV